MKIDMLYIGSMNARKAREMATLLAGLPVEVRPLPRAGVTPVPEHGDTFEANARLKALGLARQLRACVVADDSGIEVDALGGRPGVYSARYAGENATDEQMCGKLLGELQGVPEAQRTGRFRCLIAMACDAEVVLTAEGVVEGTIAQARRGANGFGYDPVFVPRGHDRTFAEMTADEKHALSHRGQALRAFRARLEAWLARP